METLRLRIRRFLPTDLENLRRLESDGEVMKHTPQRAPLSSEESKNRLEKWVNSPNSAVLAFERKSDNQFIGWIMLMESEDNTSELGFMTVRQYWNQGYTLEACERLLRHAFEEVGVSSVFAITDNTNVPSQRLLEKLGFQKEREFSSFDKKLNREILQFQFRCSNSARRSNVENPKL